MTESVFVDTNVLVYRYDASDPVKQARADAWYLHLWRRRCGRLSFQVLQEMYATLTRKLKPGIARSKAQRIVRALQAWQPITVDLSVLERAWNLQERHSLSWWDALIVAAA
ncbi:MAG: PIN domain-containing protein [Spirochaetaceae bacterium]|nr:PIN domain-containing protein [Spirochaetaceae bacterium]